MLENFTPDLSVDLGPLRLENPVLAASGTFGYGLEYLPFVDLDRLGGFSTKGLSLRPKEGNPVPRMIETESGMLNAIGLENIGLEKFLAEKLPLLHRFRTRIIVNFFGKTEGEYSEMAAALSEAERIDALEMNISCPNVDHGGQLFCSSPERVASVVSATRADFQAAHCQTGAQCSGHWSDCARGGIGGSRCLIGCEYLRWHVD